MQAQTFAQVACTHAGGLQALQKTQRHLKAVYQFFALLQVVARQTFRQSLKAVFQIAIVVDGLNKETQGSTVGVVKPQRQGLAVQEGWERFLVSRQLGGLRFFIVVVAAVVARWGVAAPLAVVR